MTNDRCGVCSCGGDYLTLEKNGDGTYTITQTDGTKENYNASGSRLGTFCP
ncbi:hypothetical protein NGI46_13170 [Peribacillus butanolivorans]|uniref:hypothetical protein n=1 Tax=Peribacillus butanolivorans TaxID=421767 RepID=UPI00207C757B|nr:hypothetical protein [Peribacillus butanolivorans]MCO0598388.1 hypothetical protein [Peribacillus butanolivorans]